MNSAPPVAVPDEGLGSSRDVEGVPSSQLQKVFMENVDAELTFIAERIGIDLSYLKRLVVDPITPVIKLGMADKILLGLNLNITSLIEDGTLTVVPLRYNRAAAKRIVDEEIAFADDVGLPLPTEAEIEARVTDLLEKYEESIPVTDEQRVTLSKNRR